MNSARFKFEPIVEETYPLYRGEKEDFLSLIKPDQWNKKYLAPFRLSGDYKWRRF